jgi:hypothetical protein
VTRLAVVLLVALALALPATAAAPARVQVAAREFSFALSRQTVASGPAILELVNYGQDAHDLRLRRVGGTHTYAIGVVQPGKVGELQATLRSGKFVLWCSIADHRARGMHAVLIVSPRGR